VAGEVAPSLPNQTGDLYIRFTFVRVKQMCPFILSISRRIVGETFEKNSIYGIKTHPLIATFGPETTGDTRTKLKN
jgi:hypothetical protein